MTEELTYADIGVKDPQKTLMFLKQHLGFINNSYLSEPEKPGFLISNRFGNHYFISLNKQEAAFNNPIVINTDDCLRDYYLLGKAGVKCEGIPWYTTNGLEVTIVDENGNKYTLLEERDYTDEL